MKLEDVFYAYENRDVLSHINLNLEKGQYIGLMGDNGSGKTTLLKLLAGLIFPASGKYIFENQIINQEFLNNSNNSKVFHQKIGYLFQNSEVQLFNPTVADEIDYGLLQMNYSYGEVKKRRKDVLSLLRIEYLEDRNSIHLSGGEKKMVAFAAMLALNPDYLLLDEPFNDLTRKNVQLIADILDSLHASGKTIIMTCHDVTKVKKNISKLIVLSNKEVKYQGKMMEPDEIEKMF